MERAGFYKTLHGTPPPCDKPRCVVCGDEASGIHYGVNSCEGCKGFFRRCMVKGMSQTCANNEECEITRFARNSCQFCRLKKCVQMGMARSASKVGRRPKTTGVCAETASVITSEQKTATKKPAKGIQKVSTHRRSQSLISPSVLEETNAQSPQFYNKGCSSTSALYKTTSQPQGGSLQNSPNSNRRGSAAGRIKGRSRTGLGTCTNGNLGSFSPPYPTPSSSRASSSGADMDFSAGPTVDSHGYVSYTGTSTSQLDSPAFVTCIGGNRSRNFVDNSSILDMHEQGFYGQQHAGANSEWSSESVEFHQVYDLSNGRQGNHEDFETNFVDEHVRTSYLHRPANVPHFSAESAHISTASVDWEFQFADINQSNFLLNRRH